jgi:hypothetical protein
MDTGIVKSIALRNVGLARKTIKRTNRRNINKIFKGQRTYTILDVALAESKANNGVKPIVEELRKYGARTYKELSQSGKPPLAATASRKRARSEYNNSESNENRSSGIAMNRKTLVQNWNNLFNRRI